MSFRAASAPLFPSSQAIGVHLAQAADIAAAENCRSDAERLIAAVYAAFSGDIDMAPAPAETVIAA